jgi:hypothetical protein
MATSQSDTFGPCCFQAYRKEHGLGRIDTASAISVDHLSRLSSALRDHDLMVFRLGSRPGTRGTWFALARAVNGYGDYFLFDDAAFSDGSAEVFTPTVPARQLAGYQYLPTLTETSSVNLAIASGLLNAALGLDPDVAPVAPATGASTFDFTVVPHSGLGVEWPHLKGQVEIDAVVTGKRAGRDVVFVIEAKQGDGYRDLAKHKLTYPVSAVASRVPPEVGIVPVYMKIRQVGPKLEFNICECEWPDPRNSVAGVDQLVATRSTTFVLLGYGA